MATPGVILSGKIRDISGNAIAGTVTATLGNYGSNAPIISGDSELAPIVVSATADGTGVWSMNLWGADQISPANTIYSINVTPANSNASQWISEYLINSGSYDLSNLIPLIVAPPIYIQPSVGPPGTGASLTVNTPSTDFTAAVGHLYLVTTGASDVTVTLPSAVGVSGQYLIVKKVDSGAGTVTLDGTIDGVSGYDLSDQNQYVQIASDNANWQITGNN